MQKEIHNLEFVQGVNFEFIDSLKSNGTKYLLIFDDSSDELWNSKVFVDIATAGRHRGLSTIYIKHNLFHQSKLGRDVELLNPHIVLFKSPGMLCNSVRLVHNWDSDHSQFTGMETQHLFPTVIYWMTSRHEQTIDYVTAQTSHPFLQFFLSLNAWSI